MIARRSGEKGDVPFRSGRFYSVGVDWYAATREGRDLGPFASRDDAQSAIADYISKLAPKTASGAHGAPANNAGYAELRVEELRQFMKRRDNHGLTAARLWAKDRMRQIEAQAMPFDERQKRLGILRYLLNQD